MKKTIMTEFRPGTFFLDEYSHKIENDLSVEEIIKKYVNEDEIETPNYESICYFVVEEKSLKGTIIKKCQIGEIHSLNRIEEEFGKDSTLYRNVANNGYDNAIKYLAGNFGYVDPDAIVYSREQVLDIFKTSTKWQDEDLTQYC